MESFLPGDGEGSGPLVKSSLGLLSEQAAGGGVEDGTGIWTSNSVYPANRCRLNLLITETHFWFIRDVCDAGFVKLMVRMGNLHLHPLCQAAGTTRRGKESTFSHTRIHVCYNQVIVDSINYSSTGWAHMQKDMIVYWYEWCKSRRCPAYTHGLNTNSRQETSRSQPKH